LVQANVDSIQGFEEGRQMDHAQAQGLQLGSKPDVVVMQQGRAGRAGVALQLD
jgi:hypothetical protein